MKKIILFFSVCSFFTINAATNTTVLYGNEAAKKVPNSEVVRFKEFTTVPNYVKFRKGNELPLVKLESWLTSFYTSDANYGIKLLKKETDKLGFTHYRYQQTVNNVPVELSTIIAHVKNGLIESVNGEFFSDVNNPVNPSLSETGALAKALQSIGATQYKWEIPTQENLLKWELDDANATYYPKGDLVLINTNGDIKKELILAYKFNIYAEKPLSRREIYVNATTGAIVWEQNKIHEIDALGTATTLYSGTKPITCDNQGGGNFRLQETGRGNGIRTFTSGNTTGYPNTNITNTSATWVMTEAGLDAHWGAEMTYDYYLNQHGRNSIDNSGFQLDSWVHYDNNYGNAFWDGTRMTYGDGSGNSTPFTAIDITGHEITHGLTENTANLVYSAESGALNESFSDIFGISIDFINRPGIADWLLGDDLGFIIRNMENPNSQGDPDTYFGTNWASLSGGDNGGVHTNSGVQNFWFVLLVDGGVGTNDNGDAYTVNSLGLTVAGQVAFRNLTVYLTSASEYADSRFFSIQAAVDLFGGCTTQVQEVTNAWYAVGVGPIYSPVTISDFDAPVLSSCSAPFTANFNNLSVNGISFNWDFGDGNTSTLTTPSNTYNSYGTFTVELITNGGPTCGIDTTTKIAYITIDSNLACISILPTNGTASTQTACAGTIYDSGGSSGQYGANEDAQITISPAGASTVDLTFISFAVEPGTSGSCNYDYVKIYDGPTTASPLIDTYCDNNVPTTVSSTVGSITIVFHSDVGVEDNGFQVNWQCQLPNQVPTVNFVADVVTTCTGVVNFTDISNNGPTSWVWDFGDGNGSTQQNPSHTYTSNGLFTVQLTATNGIGNGNLIKNNYISVNMPTAPTINGDAVCVNNFANLSANGVGTLNWYNVAIGGSIINTGNTYVTPVLSTTTSYYVEDVITSPLQNLGKPNNSGAGANYNNNQHLIFDVFQPMEIISVVVYSGAAGNRTIELRNSGGVVLQTTTVNLPNGTSTVPLNFNVSPGTNYQLGVSASSIINMFRNSAGAAYPYSISGLASITGNSAGATSYYYFFYDWKVKEPDCVSARSTVTAIVNALPNVVASNDTIICSGDAANLSATGASTYMWDNGLGAGQNQTPSPIVNTTYTVTGTDVNLCVNTDVVNVAVSICTTIDELAGTPQVTSFMNDNTIVLGLTNLEKGSYSVMLLNSLGQVVVNKQIIISLYQQTELINLPTMAKGMYYIKLYNEVDNYLIKMVR
ncbi:MAG: hypothetical protein COX70_02590 [Flavobacteriales bacterium CG_4_10_14_0_2_um_filter_32_8]|nr:MAG: hypothetical protein COX70_02590 [Flavobacteriales bacterium CG_4_10_14_0_2_um_filter_32_8]PJB14711.1 MAG: hypothetical protein CO118_07175 [Flavobacteriales bacterium CG_4_9_14_3_um_filter_32_8]